MKATDLLKSYPDCQDAIDRALDTKDVDAIACAFFAADRRGRAVWVAVLAALTVDARGDLARLLREHGTAGAREMRDAIIDLIWKGD